MDTLKGVASMLWGVVVMTALVSIPVVLFMLGWARLTGEM